MVLQVLSAHYGDQSDASKVVDVTKRIQTVVGGNPKDGRSLKVNVGPKAMGNIDPAPGAVKSLKVVYTTADGGEQQEVVAEEGTTLELQGEPKGPGPLQIVEAKYGDLSNPEATMDVTELARGVAAKHDNDKLLMSVDNKIFGKDPALQKPKQLSVTFQDAPNGPLKQLIFDEGKTAEILPGVDAPAPSAPVAVAVAVAAAMAGGGDNKQADAAINWKAANGHLEANGNVFKLKGVNWSGLETECRQFDGLDCTTAREYLDLLKAHGFNALQIPISTTMGLDVDGAPHKATSDPDLSGLSAGQALAKVIALAGERGIQVVLKMERVDETQPTPELWFDGRHSTEQVMQAWDTVLGRVKGAPNLMGVNLKGSPHGRASWGNSNSSYDWNKAAEQLANHIIQSHPDFKGLFFVEGVSEAGNVDAVNKSCYASWFGGNLQGVQNHPINLHGDGNERIVYAPRVFGPSVHQHDYFKRGDFPGCMWEVWDSHFGFLAGSGQALVVSEFGDSMESHEGRLWANSIVEYLKQKGATDGFYSSGSITGGDWKTPANDRLELLAKLQENPTKL